MGKVTKMLESIRNKGNNELLGRFKSIVGTYAIREYLASKKDKTNKTIEIEINLIGEEIIRRMGYFFKCPNVIPLGVNRAETKEI